MLEPFQTEWCPASRRVRQRLTELGLDYINRQVPVEREAAEGGQSAPLPRGGMRMLASSYTLSEKTTLPFAEAIERVRNELNAEGFGVLCEIDVQATLKEKLGVDGEPYLILGACNPQLAHQALEAEPDLGVLLPCNVVVYQRDGDTHISAVDAERMLSIVDNEQLAPIAADVKRRLGAVVARAAHQRTGGQR
jgi:uncharacterized protein (DUF302 family)